MRQLFVKIFASVLLTVLLTFAMGMVIAIWVMPPPWSNKGDAPPWSREDKPPRESTRRMDPSEFGFPPRGRQTDTFRMRTQMLQNRLAQEGVDALRQEPDEFKANFNATSYLLDETGQDLRGHDVAPEIRRIGLSAGEDILTENVNRGLVLAQRLPAIDGRTYYHVMEWRDRGGPPLEPNSFMIQGLLLRLTPVAIGLGLVCFFLARYITNPVLRLRAALRRFAEGDLQQRVGPAIGGRRDEIGELAREFDRMAERIATLLTAQRRLLRDVSHELRSPLARQRVAIELAAQSAGAETREMLARVEREAGRLDDLIGQTLMLARLESDDARIERAPLDLAQLIRSVVEDADFEARNRSCSVRLCACADCVMNGVPELLLRAVENVVRNAVAYTAEGTTVEVSLEHDTTRNANSPLSSEARMSAFIRLRVRDRGPGVPASQLSEIFRPFYRVSTARDRQSGGVGLGLAIAERAVRSHGGTITAHNAPDGGLIVEILLPFESIQGPIDFEGEPRTR